ncbi:hypothetical protein KP509_10G027500 [Ceratopteris richardii]|uniref:Retrovirus-related Pol polyprotein from transposon TNT 1-94-like beta-barrel domain-containing protein n=1 Tax=Ceratopteris richardii TaxID=49495 RepID=A0A8T2TXB7_CERRI|nr:hypothetical protein KP509_10G027500 [Ceratopteris richardii]
MSNDESLTFSPHVWVLDSGATCHLAASSCLLQNYGILYEPLEVRFGDNHTQFAIGIGDAPIVLPTGQTVVIHDVYHVPSISKNIISVSMITSPSITVLFIAHDCVIRHALDGGHYSSIHYPKLMSKSHLVQHFPLPKHTHLDLCEGFLFGKITNKRFPSNDFTCFMMVACLPIRIQNGLAEHRNRSLLDMCRYLLRTVALPHSFWEEHMMTSCYILNHTYCTSIMNIPFGLWTDEPPSYRTLRIFGCCV